MTVNRADIVLINFPFTSGTGAKVRPALIIQSDINNRRFRNTIVAMVTGRTDHVKFEATQLFIDISTTAGQSSGLLHDSAIKCENLFTVEQSLIRKTIGKLPIEKMDEVDKCLLVSLGLR